MKRLFLFSVLLMAFYSTCVFALRCDTSLVNAGDQDFQVRARCGAPFWIDHYTIWEVFGRETIREEQREVSMDIWYYNFGPNAFMQRLTFRNGILHQIDALSYGVNEIGNNCADNLAYRGLSAGELVAHCGPPLSRRENRDMAVDRPFVGFERYQPQRREDWIYEANNPSFIRVYHLLEGQVQEAEYVAR